MWPKQMSRLRKKKKREKKSIMLNVLLSKENPSAYMIMVYIDRKQAPQYITYHPSLKTVYVNIFMVRGPCRVGSTAAATKHCQCQQSAHVCLECLEVYRYQFIFFIWERKQRPYLYTRNPAALISIMHIKVQLFAATITDKTVNS